MKLSFLEDLFPSFILDAFELAFAGRFASTTPRQINFDFGIDSMSSQLGFSNPQHAASFWVVTQKWE